jgi:hypothetical protein
MKMKKYIFLLLTVSLLLFSCESEKDRKAREYKEEQTRIELVAKQKAKDEAKAILIEQERIEQKRLAQIERKETVIRLEKERKEKAIYHKYINNSLRTGSKPYVYCFGSSNSCDGYDCSQIKVKTPSNSDVLVTIKKNGKVYRHAYINSSSSYTYNIPNGRYQTFFYYGKGWNPKKFMKETTCGTLKGGFIESEHFGKDSPQSLHNNVLSYELILQQNGNFSTSPSNSNEAF